MPCWRKRGRWARSIWRPGHYARVEFDEDARRWTLRRALDQDKDQTYALYHFTQEELAHTLMPLGLVTNKAETRAIAAELGLAVSNKPDSQEICFVQGGSYTDFLAQTAPETVQSGDIRGHVRASGAARMTASRFIPSASGGG